MCSQTDPVDLAPSENIYLKLTLHIFGDVQKEKASA
jgi:hypothetical protein